jgi:hypothetical protein
VVTQLAVALLVFSCVMRNPRVAAPGLKVVSISSAEGGRPEAGLSDREIHHLASAASREDIVTGENLPDWWVMDGSVMRRYLDEGIAKQRLSTYSCCSKGNPSLVFQTGRWRHCGVVFSLGSIV